MNHTVLKFGGTSVGNPQQMKQVAQLVQTQKGKKIIVLSAVSGTTNKLVEFHDLYLNNRSKEAVAHSDRLYQEYETFITDLLDNQKAILKAYDIIDNSFGKINSLISKVYHSSYEKVILAQGELISTKLFTLYCQEQSIKVKLISALDFMRLDVNNEPDHHAISNDLKVILDKSPKYDIFITQGYICRNAAGSVDNLQRGGSDFTASLIGAAINAKEVQIWTDIDGMHNNDPRIVEKTYPIAKLSFDEAAELSYFGAKILHPACIHPAKKFNIPMRILNTMDPQAKGTYISTASGDEIIKAIAAKDNITAIKIKSSRMLMAYGFMRKVFEVFENHKTAIDMITTSEVAISCTIDQKEHLEEIKTNLREFGHVEIDHDQTIICIVGELISQNDSIVSKVFNALKNVPIRMISFGGSRNNISILIDSSLKKTVMERLNVGLFGLKN